MAEQCYLRCWKLQGNPQSEQRLLRFPSKHSKYHWTDDRHKPYRRNKPSSPTRLTRKQRAAGTAYGGATENSPPTPCLFRLQSAPVGVNIASTIKLGGSLLIGILLPIGGIGFYTSWSHGMIHSAW